MGPNITFKGVVWQIIPKFSLLPFLSGALIIIVLKGKILPSVSILEKWPCQDFILQGLQPQLFDYASASRSGSLRFVYIICKYSRCYVAASQDADQTYITAVAYRFTLKASTKKQQTVKCMPKFQSSISSKLYHIYSSKD